MINDMDFIDNVVQDWCRELPELNPHALLPILKLGLLQRKLNNRLAERLADLGLYITDFDIIATLRRSGPPFILRPSDLSEGVVLTSGGMTAALGRLESNGLIERVKAARDGRVKPVQLTKAGISLAEQAIALRVEEARTIIGMLDASDAVALTHCLTKLLERLDAADAEEQPS